MSKITENKRNNQIEILEECVNDFVKVMKIGYYKQLHKQGLVTDRQLEMLIGMQNKDIKETA